jgi:hypothetical protein
VTLAWDGSPPPELEVKAEVRRNTGALIVGVQGTRTDVANGGGLATAPITISFTGLLPTGAADIKEVTGVDIFIGGADSAGKVAMVKTKAKLFEEDKDKKWVELKTDEAIMAFLTKQIATGGGTFTLSAQVPPGQGTKQPIIISRRDAAQLFPRESAPNDEFFVSYKAATVSGYQMVVAGTAGTTNAATVAAKCKADGTSVLRFVGTDLGTPNGRRIRTGYTLAPGSTSPIGGLVVPQSSVVDCSGTDVTRAFTCVQFTCPAGTVGGTAVLKMRLEVAGSSVFEVDMSYE